MEAELISGYKGAIIAESDGRFAGNLVYQPHKSLSGIIEIKNLRIHPEVRRRNFARFMVRQLELEVEGAPALVGDVPEGQKDVITSLYACGFMPVVTLPLYETGARDVVIVKFLQTDGTQPISLQKRILSSLKPQ